MSNAVSNRVSIALCTYNSSHFLPAQLESLRKQTRQPFEIVVCDDGSKDNTLQILEEFKRSVPFSVKIFSNEKNLGFTKNFERAISLCAGEIIFLCDHDDIWLPTKIEELSRCFEENPRLTLAFCDSTLVDENLKPMGASFLDRIGFSEEEKKEFYAGGDPLKVLFRKTVPSGNTVAFQSRIVKHLLPITPYWAHDAWIVMLAAMLGPEQYIDKPLILYRQHQSQNIGVVKSGFFSRALDRWQRIVSAGHGLNVKQAKALDDLYQRASLLAEQKVLLDPGVVKLLQKKLEHFQRRASYPRFPLGRIPGIFRELCTGGYHRFENGFLSALKDLVLPSDAKR